ncbi:MAG: hypothetical protein AB7K37_16175 [Cyclobacteriaceae bacterium]
MENRFHLNKYPRQSATWKKVTGKVVDAQLEFISEEGKFNKLILYQGGREIEGKRK